MNKQKIKAPMSKIILLIFSIAFIMFFLVLLTLSILSIIFANVNNVQQGCTKETISFFDWFSKFDALRDPFSIFIEILTSIGGVFFGIRIGQWIDEREEKEKLSELWRRVHFFLSKLKLGIVDINISIRELAEYKIFWDSLQRADNAATRLLQEDKRYIDISFAFSFLAFYNYSWSIYNRVGEWKDNAPDYEEDRIEKWISSFDDLISYTADKGCIVQQ